MATYLKIEWRNSVDYGDVLYQNGFTNRIYLDVEMERPEYNVTTESDLNGANQEIPKFKKWEKVYKFTCWMQEDLVDAFTFMSTCDTIEVTPQTEETLIVQEGSMRVEYEWEEAGCLAKATVSFVTDYAVGGSCTENMNAGCLCDPETGEFTKLEAYATLGPAGDGDIELAWSTETVAGKKYIAHLYQYHTSGGLYWVELPDPEPDSCYLNQDDSTQWLFDSLFWRLMPGYIQSITYSDPNATVKGWIPEGCFMTIAYDKGGGWVDAGTFTSEDFEDIGIPINIGSLSGTAVIFILHIWNHSCDYGNSEPKTLLIP